MRPNSASPPWAQRYASKGGCSGILLLAPRGTTTQRASASVRPSVNPRSIVRSEASALLESTVQPGNSTRHRGSPAEPAAAAQSPSVERHQARKSRSFWPHKSDNARSQESAQKESPPEFHHRDHQRQDDKRSCTCGTSRSSRCRLHITKSCALERLDQLRGLLGPRPGCAQSNRPAPRDFCQAEETRASPDSCVPPDRRARWPPAVDR